MTTKTKRNLTRESALRALVRRWLELAGVEAPVHPWTLAALAGYDVKLHPLLEHGTALGSTILVPDIEKEARGREVLRVVVRGGLQVAQLPADDESVEFMVGLLEAREPALARAAA